MKKLFTIFSALALFASANAAVGDEFKIDGVTYSVTSDNEVEIKKVKYVDIFDSEVVTDDKFYKAKVVYTSLEGEGDSLKEKKVSVLMLVRAANIKGALQRLEKNLAGTASDYFIHTISETLIMDYYDFSVADVAAQPAEV